MNSLEDEEKVKEKAEATVRCKRQIEANGKLRKLHEKFKVAVVVDPKACNTLEFGKVQKIIENNNRRPENHKLFPLEISDELLMAIASKESGKAVQANGRNGDITDIYFDPCAQNITSTAMGLMQTKGEFFEQYIKQGYIISNESPPHVHAKLCGNPDLAVTYALVVLNEKYKLYRSLQEDNEHLVVMIAKYGEGYTYSRNIIQLGIALKEKGYTKDVLLDKMNEQFARERLEGKSKNGTAKEQESKSEAIKALAEAKMKSIILAGEGK